MSLYSPCVRSICCFCDGAGVAAGGERPAGELEGQLPGGGEITPRECEHKVAALWR